MVGRKRMDSNFYLYKILSESSSATVSEIVRKEHTPGIKATYVLIQDMIYLSAKLYPNPFSHKDVKAVTNKQTVRHTDKQANLVFIILEQIKIEAVQHSKEEHLKLLLQSAAINARKKHIGVHHTNVKILTKKNHVSQTMKCFVVTEDLLLLIPIEYL